MSMLPRRLSAEDDVDAKKKMIGAGWIKPGVRSVQERLAELRLEVEVEVGLLSRYSILCQNSVSDARYGAAGAPAITSEKDQWKELADRRLARVDKLTLSWRDTMMNE